MSGNRMPSAVRKAQKLIDDEEARLRQEQEDAETQGSEKNTEGEEREEDGQVASGETETPPAGEEPELDYKAEFAKLTARFNVLQGKYNSEVPVLHSQLREKDKEISELRDKSQQSGSSGDPAQVKFDPNASEQELIDLYGEDFVKYVKAEASNIVQSQIGPLRERFDKMDKDSHKEAETSFYGKLAEAHPDWEQINLMEGWLTFLGETDESSGLIRQQIIDQAQETGNPVPIIHQLNAFKSRHKSGSERLSSQAVPGDTGASPVRKTDDKVYAASTIRKFYKDVAAGAYRGREDEAAQMEAKFAAAHSERRIDETA